MYGLAAIQQANGWSMAMAGACIVISGLSVLAFLISMIPRLSALFEKKTIPPTETSEKETKLESIVPEKLPEDIKEASTIYIALTEELGDAFTLVDLYRKSIELGLPHPHLSISRFRDAGILFLSGEERFSWQPKSE